MAKVYKVLIIEDHPLIVEAYKSAFEKVSFLSDGVFEFYIETAICCDTAMSKINNSLSGKGFDIILLDIRIPPSKDGKILSGQDLGAKIRKKFRKIKIIVSTMYGDSYMISSINKSFDPDGFLVKTDLTSEKLVQAIKTVMSDSPYYSKTVLKSMRKQLANDFFIDNLDRKILYELSQGTKMNELPRVLPLSIAALERRKRILKEVFNVSGKGDRELLKLAEDKGFI